MVRVDLLNLSLDDLTVKGRVPCGPAEECWDQTGGTPLGDYLSRYPNHLEIVEVKGDSMRGAGLLPGDLLVVDTYREVRAGDLVLCLIDSKYLTIKRWTGTEVVAEPQPTQYHPIHAVQTIEALGVVIKKITDIE